MVSFHAHGRSVETTGRRFCLSSPNFQSHETRLRPFREQLIIGVAAIFPRLAPAESRIRLTSLREDDGRSGGGGRERRRRRVSLKIGKRAA